MCVMLFWFSINAQSFVNDKASPTSQFSKGKSRDLQKLLRFLSGIVISKFKDDTSGCVGWLVSPSFPGCGGLGGLYGDFPTILVLWSNDLPSETLLSKL